VVPDEQDLLQLHTLVESMQRRGHERMLRYRNTRLMHSIALRAHTYACMRVYVRLMYIIYIDEFCANFTTCADCAKQTVCGWCNYTKCVAGSRRQPDHGSCLAYQYDNCAQSTATYRLLVFTTAHLIAHLRHIRTLSRTHACYSPMPAVRRVLVLHTAGQHALCVVRAQPQVFDDR
jgi:hypothetical protein